MIPGVFEWIWDTGHLVFMGLFWLVLIVMLSGLIYAVGKSINAANREITEKEETGVRRQNK